MGTKNRDRRTAKRQKEARAERARRHAGPRPHDDEPSVDEVARAAVLAAAQAFRFESTAAFEQHLRILTTLGERGLRPHIEDAISWWVERALDRAWVSGWQPADVIRALRRALSPSHAAVISSAVLESGARQPEAGSDDRWAGQLDALRADRVMGTPGARWPDIARAVEAVSLLMHLPPLPRLASGAPGIAQPGGRSGVVLERVRALLAKAESTTFPEEAEALTAKAHSLMARHAIDRAMLDAKRERASDVVAWRIGIDDPYAMPKSVLLGQIAVTSSCRAVWSKHMGFTTVFGARDDLEMVEVMFTSLLVQATDAMTRAGRAKDRSGRSRTRSFRQLGEVGGSITNDSGWLAGRAAAELASLGVGEALTAG